METLIALIIEANTRVNPNSVIYNSPPPSMQSIISSRQKGLNAVLEDEFEQTDCFLSLKFLFNLLGSKRIEKVKHLHIYATKKSVLK